MRFLFLLFLIPFCSYSQSTIDIKDNDSVYAIVTSEPQYPGGEDAMVAFIAEHIEYPDEAISNGEQGIVYVQFTIKTDGSINNIVIRRGVSEALNNEAIRVISLMPNWIPGSIKDETVVDVLFTMPIHFRLDPKKKENKVVEPVEEAPKKKK